MNLVELAKLAIENYIKARKVISPPKEILEEFLNKRAGTFVTIEKEGNLRGCIGTYLPIKENIAREVISNAIAAATEDYRFGPVKKEELEKLSYTVYILSKPELVGIFDNVFSETIRTYLRKKLDPKKYGIIVKTIPIISPNGTDVVFNGHLPYKSGLLLPDLEGVDTLGDQIAIACQKGGIDPERDRVTIYRFTVKKYK